MTQIPFANRKAEFYRGLRELDKTLHGVAVDCESMQFATDLTKNQRAWITANMHNVRVMESLLEEMWNSARWVNPIMLQSKGL